MYIKHNKLTLRNAGAQDAAQPAAWWNDGAVMAHAGFPLGLSTTAEKVAASLAGDSDGNRRRLIIEIDDIPAGEMSYRRAEGNTAEIGIKICDASKQNHGCGKQLLSMLINALFNEFGFEKIILDTNIKNTRAQHVYEQLGFKKLRVNVDAWEDQLGEKQTSVDYELREADFINFAL